MARFTIVLFMTALSLAPSSLRAHSLGPKSDLWDLAATAPEEFEQMFRRGERPEIQAFRGKTYRGLMLSVHYGPAGKAILQDLTQRLDVLWKGPFVFPLVFENRFYATEQADGRLGRNYLPIRGAESNPFKFYLAPSEKDPGGPEVAKYDYNLEENGAIGRRAFDEMRRIPGTSLYLGEMNLRAPGGKRVPLLWFGLQAKE